MNLENEIVDLKAENDRNRRGERKVACFSKETSTDLTGENITKL